MGFFSDPENVRWFLTVVALPVAGWLAIRADRYWTGRTKERGDTLAKLRTLDRELTTAEADLRHLRAELDEVKAEYEALRRERDAGRERERTLSDKLQEYRVGLLILKTHCADLRQRLVDAGKSPPPEPSLPDGL